MKIEYEAWVSGVGIPIEQFGEGPSDPLILYAMGYEAAKLAIAIVLSQGIPVKKLPGVVHNLHSILKRR